MTQIQFEKWWGRIVSGASLLFIAWFVFMEREGLIRFGEFLVDSVVYIPTSIQIVIDYYATVPVGQLLGSVAVGALFGIITTVLLFLSTTKIVTLPIFDVFVLLIGFTVFVGGVWLGISFYLALLLGFLLVCFAGYILQSDVQEFFSARTVKLLGTQAGLRTMTLGIIIGGLAGAFGSQVLAYPMQHCTYAVNATGVDRQIGYTVTAISALFVLVPVWAFIQRRRQSRDMGTAGYFRSVSLPFLFLAPTLISLFVFLYFPAVQVATLSLSQVRSRRSRFACLENYVDLAGDTIYQNSFIVTLSLTVMIVALTMFLALSVALLASQKVRGASIYRTLLIWPYALSPVVVGTIFLSMFRQGRTGLINYGVSELFGTTFDWLTDPNLAPWVIVFASVYNALGFNILFYVAGLQNIPEDLLEAAQIDGANVFQRFMSIKLPLLSPFTFFLLVTNITYSFYGIYGAVDTLTQGGPPLGLAGEGGGATDVLIYKLYTDAFAPSGQIGQAAAQSIILFILVAALTLFQFGYLERRVTYSQ